MKENYDILILEDHLGTLSVIFGVLRSLGGNFHPVVLSKSSQVKKLLNKSDLRFDVILLDHFCAEGRSFHALDIKRFGAKKIIAMSASSVCNDELKRLGVKRIINKDVNKLDAFADKLAILIKEVVSEELGHAAKD